MPVQIYNSQRKIAVERGRWDVAFELALIASGHPDSSVEVTFVSNKRIAEINREWRGKNVPTDCLSFPFPDEVPLFPGSTQRPLGDIVISLEQALSQGPVHFQETVSPDQALYAEVVFLFIHSLLHLLGYDHETSEADAAAMRAEEQRILNKIGMKA